MVLIEFAWRVRRLLGLTHICQLCNNAPPGFEFVQAKNVDSFVEVPETKKTKKNLECLPDDVEDWRPENKMDMVDNK